MTKHYEVTFDNGISDVIEFDSYDDAVAYAMRLHQETKKKIDVAEVTEKLIVRIGE